jgi:hypothetical protein
MVRMVCPKEGQTDEGKLSCLLHFGSPLTLSLVVRRQGT